MALQEEVSFTLGTPSVGLSNFGRIVGRARDRERYFNDSEKVGVRFYQAMNLGFEGAFTITSP